MKTSLKGGCACGAVRYEIRDAPTFSLICQCRQCQRITGAGHAAQFAALSESLSVRGEIRYYELHADSGNTVSSGFCPVCGCPILKKSTGFPQNVFIHAATLDDPGVSSRKCWSGTQAGSPGTMSIQRCHGAEYFSGGSYGI